VAYATPEEVFDYLPDLAGQSAAEAVIEKLLDRASAYIDRRLGYAFGTQGTGSRVVYGDGSDFLVLPPDYVAGSVTNVTTQSDFVVPSYIEQDNCLVVTRNGLAAYRFDVNIQTPSFNNNPNYVYDWISPGWMEGVPFTVAATFGYGAAPADIVECCLELTVRMWRGKDAGFSDVVGVEGRDAVGYNGAEPAFVKKTLDFYSIYTGRKTVGVW
jgi:hypothetical protein